MAGHEALVSVIMPVYNAEKYLTQALDSLLAQDYPNFEVLCVDDGSMDTSKVILATYARQNPRIRVIRVENGGQARARQIGIQHAKGSLITFMDSDDLVPIHHRIQKCYRIHSHKAQGMVPLLSSLFHNRMQGDYLM